MTWQPKIGTFLPQTIKDNLCWHCGPQIELLAADCDSTLSICMSHYMNVLVTYKEEANILYSAVLPTWRQKGKSQMTHAHWVIFFSGRRKQELNGYQVIHQ